MKAIPFLLKPVGKNYLWGGERLKKDFNKKIDISPLAETWECSTHNDGISIVSSGKYSGKNLKEVLKENPEYLGKYANSDGELPVLVKLIDADKKLSVQVHPDDKYARTHENQPNGKNEMWYVLDSKPDSKLVYGFNKPVTEEELKIHLESGTIEPYLNQIPVKKGDVFFIKAGTVHAIGEGLIIAEIQQSSNLTYRLFDYNRTDSDGNKRELHIQKALDVIKTDVKIPENQKHYISENRELLLNSEYFEVIRLIVNPETDLKINSDEKFKDTFQILLCIDGKGEINTDSGEKIPFIKGDCIFIPADSVCTSIKGSAELLEIII